MANINLDKNTISYLKSLWVKKIKVLFYDAWCSWTKIDLLKDFDINEDTVSIEDKKEELGFQIYAEKKDVEKLKDCTITRVVKADHTGKQKIRYIFTSKGVKDRCGCGTSFSFEKKKPKLNIEKLKSLKANFKRT